MPGDQMSLLTVQQFDDVLTDLLLDKIFLWFRTFKLNPSYRETNVSREILVDIVKRNVIQLNKLNDAVHELL
ncbi:9353_t:CDS:1, partial [Dentiscutata erythropus]